MRNAALRHASSFVVAVGFAATAMIVMPDHSAAQAAPRPKFTIIMLGDSYGSGEASPEIHGQYAAPDYLTGTAETWTAQGDNTQRRQARRCHRSPRATAGVAADSLRARYPEIDIVFISFACSGAKITSGILEPYEGAELELLSDPKLSPQITQVNDYFASNPAATIDALVMNIGGNDANFAGVVLNCLIVPIEIKGCQNNPTTGAFLLGLNSLPTLYARLDDAIDGRGTGVKLRASLHPSAVLITEYPDPTHRGAPQPNNTANPENYCFNGASADAMYNHTNPDEGRYIHEAVVTQLNAQVRAAAQAAGWTHVAGAMVGSYAHGLCAGAATWFRGSTEALRIQGADAHAFGKRLDGLSSGMVHPNEAGYVGMAQYLIQPLEAQLRQRFGSTTIAAAPPRLSATHVTAALSTLPTSAPVTDRRLATARPMGAVPQGRASGNITIQWTDPIPGGSRRFILETNGVTRDIPAATTSYTVNGSGRFKFTIRACGGLLCTAPSPELIVSNIVPGVPAGVRKSPTVAGQTFAGTLGVSWAPDDENAEYFEIQYRPASSTTTSSRPVPGVSATISKTASVGTSYQTIQAKSSPAQIGAANAPLGTSAYEVKVRACSQAGCSAFSEPVTMTPGASPARSPNDQ
jgi:hypothetical protein